VRVLPGLVDTWVPNEWDNRRRIWRKTGGAIKIVLSLVVVITMNVTNDFDSAIPY